MAKFSAAALFATVATATPGVVDIASARSFLQRGDVESRIRAGGSVALEALAGAQSLESGAMDAAREAAVRESATTALRIAALRGLARTTGHPAASNVVDANGDMIASTIVVPSFLQTPHVRVLY